VVWESAGLSNREAESVAEEELVRWVVVLNAGDKGIVGKNDLGEWCSEDGRIERSCGQKQEGVK